MRVFFLWPYPVQYVRDFYRRHPQAAALGFEAQRRLLLDDHFGWAGDLSRHMAATGFETEFVVSNAAPLQAAWAREQGFAPPAADAERAIALEQIRRWRPDVVWVTSRFDYFGEFTRAIRRCVRRVLAWVGEPWPTPPDLGGISALITENPATFREAHGQLERVIVTKPGFSPDVLRQLGPAARRPEVVFVGQIHGVHRRRAALLARALEAGLPLAIHGFTAEDDLPTRRQGARLALWQIVRRRAPRAAAHTLRRAWFPSAYDRHVERIRRVLRPPVFGMELYRRLAEARLVLNVHGDIAGRHAGNMRMFEATGVGSCLVTEQADNLASLFEPGREAAVYREDHELVPLLERLLAAPEEAERIGRRGQERTLRDHTPARMLDDIRPALEG